MRISRYLDSDLSFSQAKDFIHPYCEPVHYAVYHKYTEPGLLGLALDILID